jgi:hypothetical protein
MSSYESYQSCTEHVKTCRWVVESREQQTTKFVSMWAWYKKLTRLTKRMTPTFVCKAREDNSTRWCPSYVCWSNTVTGSIYHDISTINKYHSFSQVMYVNFAGQHLGRQEFLRLARYDSNLACVNSSIFWKPQLVVDLFRAYTALSIYIYTYSFGDYQNSVKLRIPILMFFFGLCILQWISTSIKTHTHTCNAIHIYIYPLVI